MPFEKVEKEWLQPFADNAENLLKEYDENIGNFHIEHPMFHPKWHILFMKDTYDGEHENLHKLPLLKSLFDNIPEDVYLVLSMYSVISPGMVGQFHSEPYPRQIGYRRYHVPLRVPENVRFEIQGEDLYDWKVGDIYEFVNPGTMHRILYPEGNEDRIVFLIDVFEGHKPTKEELQQCYDIGGKFLEKNNVR